jgi:hypothetical protein
LEFWCRDYDSEIVEQIEVKVRGLFVLELLMGENVCVSFAIHAIADLKPSIRVIQKHATRVLSLLYWPPWILSHTTKGEQEEATTEAAFTPSD